MEFLISDFTNVINFTDFRSIVLVQGEANRVESGDFFLPALPENQKCAGLLWVDTASHPDTLDINGWIL